MQITYQKRDGSIIQKYRNTMLPYKIGETTSMGWKVLSIKYEYKGNYYTESEYSALIHKEKQEFFKKKKSTEVCKSEIKKFLYYFIAAIAINSLKTLLGI